MPTKSYQMPMYGSPADQLLGWCLEAKQEGAAWLAAQKPALTWPASVSLMEDIDPATMSTTMSNTQYPKAKRIARELVASLASFRHEGEFKVLWDNSLYDLAHLVTSLDRNWYLTAMPNEQHRSGLQTAVVKGTAYWVETWDKHFWGMGKGDVRLEAFDPADVTFVQLPADRDIQRAYMVIIRREMPINLARRIFAPVNLGFANSLVPDRDSPGWLQRGLDKVQKFLSPALRAAGRQNNMSGSFPTVDVYEAYTMDGSVNESLIPMQMGAAGTNWAYTVPALGDPIPTDVMNPSTGAPMTRAATYEDCLLFPLRRHTIFSNTGICTDGSSPYWHGDAPVARIWFNDLPWQALGGSLISDVRTMEEGIGALMRGMEDSAAARLDPPAIYDDTLVSASWAKAFNPRLAGTRAAAPLMQGNPITYPIDPHYYDVPSFIPQFMEAQEGRMDYITSVRDLVAVAKAKQIPGADTIEKLLEMAGPIVQDMVRSLEKPLTQLGEWRKAMYFQYYNIARVIRTVGPDEFDMTGWNLQPDRLNEIRKHGSFQFRPAELLNMSPVGLSPQAARDRLKRNLSELRYEITESGVNEIYRMTTKLFYMRLMESGKFPISWWTFARIAKIPNFGPPPTGTNTELERWIAQKHIEIDLQVSLQQEVQGAMGAPGGEGEIPGADAIAAPGGGNGQGRPNAWTGPPKMVQKDQGQRTTITTT